MLSATEYDLPKMKARFMAHATSVKLLSDTAYLYSEQVVYELHNNIVTWAAHEVPSTNHAHSLQIVTA